ncbi:hypothetical protein QL285_067725 [Trifolium repens]|nr:hypothetical protein QL285_067725 [Trifolium repens]
MLLKRHADKQTAADLSRQTSPQPVAPPAKQPASTNTRFNVAVSIVRMSRDNDLFAACTQFIHKIHGLMNNINWIERVVLENTLVSSIPKFPKSNAENSHSQVLLTL